MASIPIKIKDQAGTTTLFEIDGEIDVATGMANRYRPVWARQEIPRKTGNNKQFLGTEDGEVTIEGVLRGTQEERVTKKNTLRTLTLSGTIVRIDTNGYDTSVENRNYVILDVNVPQQGGSVWQFSITLEELN